MVSEHITECGTAVDADAVLEELVDALSACAARNLTIGAAKATVEQDSHGELGAVQRLDDATDTMCDNHMQARLHIKSKGCLVVGPVKPM